MQHQQATKLILTTQVHEQGTQDRSHFDDIPQESDGHGLKTFQTRESSAFNKHTKCGVNRHMITYEQLTTDSTTLLGGHVVCFYKHTGL